MREKTSVLALPVMLVRGFQWNNEGGKFSADSPEQLVANGIFDTTDPSNPVYMAGGSTRNGGFPHLKMALLVTPILVSITIKEVMGR